VNVTTDEKRAVHKLSIRLQTIIEKWEDARPHIEIMGATLCKDGSVSLYFRKSERKIKRKRGVWISFPTRKKVEVEK
jgi:hypothetical protein